MPRCKHNRNINSFIPLSVKLINVQIVQDEQKDRKLQGHVKLNLYNNAELHFCDFVHYLLIVYLLLCGGGMCCLCSRPLRPNFFQGTLIKIL